MKVAQNILLIDDYLVVRKGVELILNENLSNITFYKCATHEEGLLILNTVKIDILLLDITINGIENSRIISQIKKLQPEIKILVFTTHDEKSYGFRYITNGADGFLNKMCSEQTIAKAIRSLIDEGYYYSAALKSKLEKSNLGKNINPIDTLSNREFEISKMLVEGLGNLEISNKLNIKMSTVSTYKNRVYEKLNLNNVVALSELFKK